MHARAEQTLDLLRRALGELRRADPDLTVQQVLTLIEIALDEGTTVSRISEDLEISQSAVTRNVDILGSYGRGNRRALGWVEREDDEEDRRVRRLFLSNAGRSVLQKVIRMRPVLAHEAGTSRSAPRRGADLPASGTRNTRSTG